MLVAVPSVLSAVLLCFADMVACRASLSTLRRCSRPLARRCDAVAATASAAVGGGALVLLLLSLLPLLLLTPYVLLRCLT